MLFFLPLAAAAFSSTGPRVGVVGAGVVWAGAVGATIVVAGGRVVVPSSGGEASVAGYTATEEFLQLTFTVKLRYIK